MPDTAPHAGAAGRGAGDHHPSGGHPHHSIVDPEPAGRHPAVHPAVDEDFDWEFDEVPMLRPLLDQVPEFIPAYRAMAAECGDEPGEPSVLLELADFVAGHVAATRRQRALVERILAVVETHLGSMADDDEGCELVAFAFFDALDPELRAAVAGLAGPLSRALIEELDAPTAPEAP